MEKLSLAKVPQAHRAAALNYLQQIGTRVHKPLRVVGWSMSDNANGGMHRERYIREKHRSGVWKM